MHGEGERATAGDVFAQIGLFVLILVASVTIGFVGAIGCALVLKHAPLPPVLEVLDPREGAKHSGRLEPRRPVHAGVKADKASSGSPRRTCSRHTVCGPMTGRLSA